MYPLHERREHILIDALCNCMPEVKETGKAQTPALRAGARVIVHKKIGDGHPMLPAHWVGG